MRYKMVVFLLLVLWLTQPLFLESRESRQLVDTSGFITIEPVDYYFFFQSHFNRLNLKSNEARMWYSFQRADENSETKPLFIFFNGGPSSGTTQGLMSYNTGRKAYCPDTDSYKPNPVSWTQLGNLLWVDARRTGLSYSLMAQHSDIEARYRTFGAQNFNTYFDAADTLRVLLTILEQNPVIRGNPVIIVGESCGGLRTTAMLHILLNYKDYANGKAIYQDETLVQQIQTHYDAVFPGYSGREVPPEVIITQFGRQILIQPAISLGEQNRIAGEMFEQEGSVMYRIAGETGLEYVPCRQQQGDCSSFRNALNYVRAANRDVYMYAKPGEWMSWAFDRAANALQTTANLSILTGVDVTQIEELYAEARRNGFKLAEESDATTEPQNYKIDYSTLPEAERWLMETQPGKITSGEVAPSSDMEEIFGKLNPWDLYYIRNNTRARYAFYTNIACHMGYDIDPYSPIFGKLFLENVAHVKTFITNAAYDLIVYSPAMVPMLRTYTGILRSAEHEVDKPGDVERPGRILLTYREGVFPGIANLKTRTIRYPKYSKSSHCVPLTEPEAMFTDVSKWLKE
ncbi:MAG: S10 family peptidase [bacterium]|nr:S10 family peptidase [bacterium]